MVAPLRETHGADGKIRKADLPLVIFANGGLEGGLGCGALVGSYHQDGGSLTIKAASVLAGWCPNEDDRQNRKLLDVLNAVQSLKKVDAGFHLFDDKGNLLAVLAPTDLS